MSQNSAKDVLCLQSKYLRQPDLREKLGKISSREMAGLLEEWFQTNIEQTIGLLRLHGLLDLWLVRFS